MEEFTSVFFSLLIWLGITAVCLITGYYFFKKFTYNLKVQKGQKPEDKAFLFVKIPAKNEQREGAMDEMLKTLHRVLPDGATISLEMCSKDQFLRFFCGCPS